MAVVDDRYTPSSPTMTAPCPTHPTRAPTYQSTWTPHKAPNSRQSWQSYLSPTACKHALMARDRAPRNNTQNPSHPLPDADCKQPCKRSKRSATAQAIRWLVGDKRSDNIDPSTVPLQTKRQQKKQRKRERREIQRLSEYQRKEYVDKIERAMAEKERERQLTQHHLQDAPTMRGRVKMVFFKTANVARKVKRQKREAPPQPPIQVSEVPHIDDFGDKDELQSWLTQPAAVETLTAPALEVVDIPQPSMPELPAEPAKYMDDIAKRPFEDPRDLTGCISPPPALRSPSPDFTSLPRRGITLGEVQATSSNKQMQCDSCLYAIKITNYYYSCLECDNGDRIYCERCLQEGRTCRHNLDEKMRSIKRHPTNPQASERRVQVAEDVETSTRSENHIELSAGSPQAAEASTHRITLLEARKRSSPSQHSTPASMNELRSPVSPLSESDAFRDFEAKRREQEVVFREKEVTLREREAMLREREALTACREREAVFVQQLHATAIVQQQEKAVGIGAQFPSSSPNVWRTPSLAKYAFPTRNVSSSSNKSGIVLESPAAMDLSAHPELASVVAGFEQSASGAIRSRGSGNKRKAGASNTGKQNDNSSAKPQDNNPFRRRPSKKSNDDRDDGEDDEGEDGGSGSPKRLKQETGEAPKVFACPYCKYDPARYSERNKKELEYRKCITGFFRDMSRLKQHLKRVHHRPEYYCQRCFEGFDTNELLVHHTSQEAACVPSACPYPEKLDEDQQKQIHTKRPGRNPEKLWYEIFSIIFPHAPHPESPYVEDDVESRHTSQQTLDTFMEVMNSMLNDEECQTNLPWITQPESRHQFDQLMEKVKQQALKRMASPNDNSSSPLPSVKVSPVSPPQEFFWSSNQQRPSSRRTSSSKSPKHHRRQSSLQVPPHVPRPILKVNTSDMPPPSSISSTTPTSSAKSAQSFDRLKVALPMHVREDQGYDQNSSSWRSGDDQGAMTGYIVEPSSATSSGSRKSVSFATPPEQPVDDNIRFKFSPSLADSGYRTGTSVPSQAGFPYSQVAQPQEFSIPPSGYTYNGFVDPRALQISPSIMTSPHNTVWDASPVSVVHATTNNNSTGTSMHPYTPMSAVSYLNFESGLYDHSQQQQPPQAQAQPHKQQHHFQPFPDQNMFNWSANPFGS